MTPGVQIPGYPGGVVVLDNGTGYLKIGWAGEERPRKVVPNLAGKKIEAGSKILYENAVGDIAQYFALYPSKRGILLDPDLQLRIWKSALFTATHPRSCHKIDNSLLWKPLTKDMSDTCLLLLIQVNQPPEVLEDYIKMVFEGTSFGGLIILEQASQVPYAFRAVATPECPKGGSSMMYPPIKPLSRPSNDPASKWLTSLYSEKVDMKWNMNYVENSSTTFPTKPNEADVVYPNKIYEGRGYVTQLVQAGSIDLASGKIFERSPWSLPTSSNRCALIVDLGHQSLRVTPIVYSTDNKYPKKVIAKGARRVGNGGVLLSAMFAKGLALRSPVDPGNNLLLIRSLFEEAGLCYKNKIEFEMDLKKKKSDMRLPSSRSFVSPGDENFVKKVMRDADHLELPLPIYRKKGGLEADGPIIGCLSTNRVHPYAAGRTIDEKAEERDSNDVDVNNDSESVPLTSLDRYFIGEALFRPSLIPIDYIKGSYLPSEVGSETLFRNGLPSLQETVADAIDSCPLEFQSDMASQILLCGGLSNINGVEARLASDLRELLQDDYNIGIYSIKDSNVSGLLPWIGASMRVGAYPNILRHSVITKQMYREQGARNLAFTVMYNLELFGGIDHVMEE